MGPLLLPGYVPWDAYPLRGVIESICDRCAVFTAGATSRTRLAHAATTLKNALLWSLSRIHPSVIIARFRGEGSGHGKSQECSAGAVPDSRFATRPGAGHRQ